MASLGRVGSGGSSAGLVSAAALASLAILVDAPAAAAQCERDDALSRASAALLSAAERLEADSLLAAIREEGGDAPVARALRSARGEAPEAWFERARAEWGAPIICGEARNARESLWIVAPRAGRLIVESEGADRVLRVELVDGFHEPIVWLEDDSGDVRRVVLEPGERRRLSGDVARLQLTAVGEDGPIPVAEHEFRAVSVRSLESAESISLERAESITEWARALRRGAGRSVLRRNRLMERAAREHAEAVCSSGRTRHRLEGLGPEERLRARGLAARDVGEVVARASDASGALRVLALSLSHRAALLAPGFTDLGASSAEADGEVCVVVLLAAWPRVVVARSRAE